MTTVILHQSPRCWGMPCASPFGTKTEFFLRAAKIPYANAGFNPQKAPRGKMPYIKLNGTYIPDSERIYDVICKEFKADFDSFLTADQKHLSHSLRRTLENGTYFNVLWNRWGDDANWKKVKADYFSMMPSMVRAIIPEILRKGVIRTCKGHGVGKYSAEELSAATSNDVNAVVHFMDDKGPYFFGERLSKIDFTVYAFLLSLEKGQEPRPFKLELHDRAKIKRYVAGIEKTFFADMI